ncbi:MAG: hypothetical protein E3J72_14210 [Planctomycetota bacterium]|nr:MAG: hypothetical protein E3J72_14210 [Planctomycetota bacterium]
MAGKKLIPLIILMVLSLMLWSPGCGGGSKSSRSSSGGGGSTGGTGGGGGGTGGGGGGNVSIPFGQSSNGTGGDTGVNSLTTSSGVNYNVIVPSSYGESTPNEFLIVYSGSEGGSVMTNNLVSMRSRTGVSSFIFAVLDGPTYRGNGQAGADVLGDVRAKYNIDNDRTYLLGESAGSTGAAELGFNIGQSYFAAYWANDIVSSMSGYGPSKTASELGFAPWGNVGPGGQMGVAGQLVAAMRDAGYRLPSDAPYSGPGSTQHGAIPQLEAALSFFLGKTRQ